MSTPDIMLGGWVSAEQSVATLRAEREAYDTFCEYLRAVDDHMQCDRAGACFTADAEVTYHMQGPPLVLRGRHEFVRYLEGVKPALQMSSHVLGQHRFSWFAGAPRLCAYVTAWHWFLANSHLGVERAADFTTVGYAEDVFEHVAGKWLIRRRLVKPAAGLVSFGARPPAHVISANANPDKT